MAAAGPGADGERRETAAALIKVLERARDRGLLGPGAIENHLRHALGFAEAAGGPRPGLALDLGSGGGIPGLVLAVEWPGSEWMLLDSRVRSTRFLIEAVAGLGLEPRVRVIEARAEAAAHDGALRGSAMLVVSRGLAGPAVTAECAAGFLANGGQLVVSEPPGSTGARWPAGALAELALGPVRVVESAAGYRYAVLQQLAPCPPGYPRRAGIPAKRPLF